ncbi:hypothetical protein GCM10007933_41330 [Zoogloea oryzae]|uniref:Uncharacterized protein n=1 Tax=Zoogloea oryzae TaxID=310767 RepID=A0ABQ6FHA8_9RHOO|nr:hypothetical protein GCM10007933_41330 [Zoogloea oryzae]
MYDIAYQPCFYILNLITSDAKKTWVCISNILVFKFKDLCYGEICLDGLGAMYDVYMTLIY